MNLGISSEKSNGKAKKTQALPTSFVLSFAEKNGHIKYMGISDLWMHKENGCNGTLRANGQPGHFDCAICGTTFRKQPMLGTQMDTRIERAKDLLPTVYLEHRTERGRWSLARDDGNGFPGDVLTEGGGETYPTPLNNFKGIREATLYAKKHFPDAKVVVMNNI